MDHIDYMVLLEIEQRTEHITSIKSIEIIPLKNPVIKGIIQCKINENEYIADKLIHGDVINFIDNLFPLYMIEVEWI